MDHVPARTREMFVHHRTSRVETVLPSLRLGPAAYSRGAAPYPVTAPIDAEDTSLAYLAMAPDA